MVALIVAVLLILCCIDCAGSWRVSSESMPSRPTVDVTPWHRQVMNAWRSPAVLRGGGDQLQVEVLVTEAEVGLLQQPNCHPESGVLCDCQAERAHRLKGNRVCCSEPSRWRWGRKTSRSPLPWRFEAAHLNHPACGNLHPSQCNRAGDERKISTGGVIHHLAHQCLQPRCPCGVVAACGSSVGGQARPSRSSCSHGINSGCSSSSRIRQESEEAVVS